MRNLTRSTCSLLLAVLWIGCGSDITKTGGELEDDDPPPAESSDDSPVTDETSCGFDEIPRDGECVLATRRLFLTVSAGTFSHVMACSTEVVDEEEYAAFRRDGRGELLEEAGDCSLWQSPTPGPDGSVFDGTGLKEVPIPEGITASVDGVELPLTEPLWETCRETSDDVSGVIVPGQTYSLTAAAEGVGDFEAEIVVPEDPEPEFGEFERGDDFEVTWTPAGAHQVRVLVDAGEREIRCETPDDGELEVPARLTGELPDEDWIFASFRSELRETLRPGDELVVQLTGEVYESISETF